ncbi:protease Do-like 5, chloroplastic isoform X1 [Selaginella moellendorffii]|uniref:protease Do-like 5, chloroplastic isoform X1 n=1 Tax=Selaginella moellendorffii TaxID=88036 RepID=UPI000D1C32E9|nr:protease Do-like 5, chloroplastic isoform X1 [Selaginella moellendorffii]|eukprot:XP_024545117.1 protease Do-like 5, chloroplastic isoform X1 [Selaginella moellendorffii]
MGHLSVTVLAQQPSKVAMLPTKSGFVARRSLLMGSLAMLQVANPRRAFGRNARDNRDEDQEFEIRTMQLFESTTRSVVAIQDLDLSSNVAAVDMDDGEIQGIGSGFVWDRFGHIVTNYHVISKIAKDTSGKKQIKVVLLALNGDVDSYNAAIIGLDPSRDLAVLKVQENLFHWLFTVFFSWVFQIEVPESSVLRPAVIGSSKDLRVGQNCYAIGNPYGYEHTLTTGVVSGLCRQIPSPSGKPIFGAIQTDASINAGNSGGPLLDSFGRVIGINTATFTRRGSGTSSGVNFAVAIDLVRQVVPHLIVEGAVSSSRSVERGVLGPPRYLSLP